MAWALPWLLKGETRGEASWVIHKEWNKSHVLLTAVGSSFVPESVSCLLWPSLPHGKGLNLSLRCVMGGDKPPGLSLPTSVPSRGHLDCNPKMWHCSHATVSSLSLPLRNYPHQQDSRGVGWPPVRSFLGMLLSKRLPLATSRQYWFSKLPPAPVTLWGLLPKIL